MFQFLKGNLKKISDESLIGEVAAGNHHAFNEIYIRYHKIIYSYFFRMLYQDKLKSEDFLQDLFIKILDNASSFDVEKSFKTWIFSIAHNMCKNEYKRNEVRNSKQKDILYEKESSREPDIHIALDNEKFYNTLFYEINKLEEHQRESFLLRYRQNLSIREIAEIMNCSEGTVKSRIFYSLKKITVNLKNFNPENIVKI
jgi:RNA polymerase sigma-70 factor (ECF subfamily)